MSENKAGKSVFASVGYIYNFGPVKRSIVILIGFQALLWLIFSFSYILHRDAWINVIPACPGTAAVGSWWTTLIFIILNNLFICILIAAGNLFVRFNIVTPGLIVLIVQAAMIGWLAGSNGFEMLFKNAAEANIQFLKIGLWETTAYALTCAVTITKSLNISETFPAKEWSETRKLKDIKLNRTEMIILIIAIIALISAAIIETYKIFA